MALQWLSLIATIWLQCINGTNTNFPSYSSQLKQILNLSQLQLNNLAFASDAGKLFGWISGVAAAYLPLSIVLIIGSSLGLFGYGAQYLFVVNQTSSMSYVHVFLLTVVAGNSICWINTVCYIVLIQNFPLDRQLAVGISTSYVVLSAKIFNDIVNVVDMMGNFGSSEQERAKIYLLLNAILPLIVCVIISPFLKDFHFANSRKICRGFFLFLIITIVTGIFAVISSLNLLHVILPREKLSTFLGLILMGVFLILPILVPLVEKIKEKMERKCFIRVDMKFHAEIEVKSEEGENGRQIMVFDGVKLLVQKCDFWLYYFCYLFGGTIGLVYMNNLGQIVESRGSSSATSSLVSISSAFSFFGRLIPAFLDYCSHRKNYEISRPASIGAMVGLMGGAFFLLVEDSNISLHISTATIGLCTGAITSISVCTTTNLFGTKNFGINHNILITNIPVGSFLYGNLAAKLYQRARVGTQNGNCIGEKCYQTTFIVWGCFCCFGSLMAFVLHTRTKTINSQIL